MQPTRLLLHTFFISSVAYPLITFADEEFNPAMLEQNGILPQHVDLSSFGKKNQQMPGVYHVSLIVNGEHYPARDLNFKVFPGTEDLSPCLTVAIFKEIKIKISALPMLSQEKDSTCINISKSIPDSHFDFDFSKQILKITVPQAAIDQQARGYIPPEQWQQGIPAILANYQFSGSHTDYRDDGSSLDQQYLNLRSGLNFGAWRFRNYSTYTSSGSTNSWKSSTAYLERDIAALKGELTIGNDFTASDIFDSIPFLGVHLASDDNMLPDSMKGFAPVVRGIAKSNATVTIRQNGYVIYQSYVPPGPFDIKDLYPTSTNGDLNVTVTESDGSATHFIQPYSTVPILQREGHLKYDFTIGEYDDTDSMEKPKFSQLTFMWGGPYGITMFGGGQYSELYRGSVVGVGKNLGDLGALSFDVTAARAELGNSDICNGRAYRVLYEKSFALTGMDVQFTSIRYSNYEYYSFADAMDTYDNTEYDDREKEHYQISINQPFGSYGSMYINDSEEKYWDASGVQRLLQVGYDVTLWGVNISLSYNYTGNYDAEDDDRQFALNLSIPLNKFMSDSWASYSLTNDNHGRTTQQTGLNGSLLEGHNLNYNIQEEHTNQGEGNSGSSAISYQGGYGQFDIGYNFDSSQRQVNYGLSGGMVAHQHGITLSQELGETVALVQAPGANDVKIQNQSGVETDWRGYTVLPFVSPYRENTISLDPLSLPSDVELESTSKSVVPTFGAVVLADFTVHKGYKSLLTLIDNGVAVPFGAMVSVDDDTTNTGLVGDNGQVFLTGLHEDGTLLVRWGNLPHQQCHTHFHIPQKQESMQSLPFISFTQQCVE